jgi:hypothetical protein
MDYTSPENLKGYIDIQSVNDDELLTALITAYSAQVDSHCQQVFGEATYTNQRLPALVDPDGSLFCRPAVPSISTITAAAWRVRTSATWNVLDTADLDTCEAKSGCTVTVLETGYSSYTTKRLEIRLSYTGGWTNLAAVPKDFEIAVRRLVYWAYKLREVPIAKTAMPDMGQIVIPPSGWPKDIRAALAPYVRRSL